MNMTDVSEVRTDSIITALMMKALRTSETSVNFNMTTRYITEDSNFESSTVYRN
jgi:hypothetical protein